MNSMKPCEAPPDQVLKEGDMEDKELEFWRQFHAISQKIFGDKGEPEGEKDE